MNQCHCAPPPLAEPVVVTVDLDENFTWERFFGEVFMKAGIEFDRQKEASCDKSESSV